VRGLSTGRIIWKSTGGVFISGLSAPLEVSVTSSLILVILVLIIEFHTLAVIENDMIVHVEIPRWPGVSSLSFTNKHFSTKCVRIGVFGSNNHKWLSGQ
jgi:hypothetical protein